jgi:hypothetical protein
MTQNRTAQSRSAVRAISPAVLLTGFLAGPVLWSLHLLISQILISAACSRSGAGFWRTSFGALAGWQLVLLLVTLAFVLLIIAVNLTAMRSWRRNDDHAGIIGSEGGSAGRSSWLALAGILLSAFFLIGIVAAGVPLNRMSGCSYRTNAGLDLRPPS